jgi:O-antigen ligase
VFASPPDDLVIRESSAARAADRTVALTFCLAAAIAAGAGVARGHALVTVVLLGAVLYGILFLRSPAVALLAYVATRPAVDAFVLLQAGPLTVGQLWGAGLIIVLIVFLVGTVVESGRARGVPLPVSALIALYALLAARGDTAIALQFGLKLTMWLLLIVAVERIAQTRSGQVACFRAGYALALGCTVLIGILAATNRYGGSYYETFAVSQGTEQGPQALAFLAVFSISFPLIALLQRWWPLLSMALVAALAIEVTISYVRTGLVGLMLMVLVYIFVAVRRRRPAAFVLAGAFAVAAYVVQDRLAARFSDVHLLWTGDASEAGSNRVAIWTSVWDATAGSVHTAVAGAGAGASHALSEEAIGHYVDAHNDFLEFFATGGILLVAAYAVFIAWAVGSVWRLYRDPTQSSRARASAAVAFGVIAAFLAISSLSSISFYAALVPFAILLGLIRGMTATPGGTCFDPKAHSQTAQHV